MGACREGHNIWWSIANNRKALTRRMFWFRYRGFGLNEYLWHDSFGKYLWRIICPIAGHAKLVNVDADEGLCRWHCFRCERDVENQP